MRLKTTAGLKVVCCGMLPRYDGGFLEVKMTDFIVWLARNVGEKIMFSQENWDYFAKDGYTYPVAGHINLGV